MRTQEEILARIESVKQDDVFGFQRSDLIEFLTFENAKPFLVKEYVAQVEAGEIKYEQQTDPVAIIRDYMAFAWDKANDRRGLSAMRTMEHMQTWLWLAGEDVLANKCKHYNYYGKPQLVEICEKYGIDWKSLDDDVWVNDELDNHHLTSKDVIGK